MPRRELLGDDGLGWEVWETSEYFCPHCGAEGSVWRAVGTERPTGDVMTSYVCLDCEYSFFVSDEVRQEAQRIDVAMQLRERTGYESYSLSRLETEEAIGDDPGDGA